MLAASGVLRSAILITQRKGASVGPGHEAELR
jgi:hypothetical protein